MAEESKRLYSMEVLQEKLDEVVAEYKRVMYIPHVGEAAEQEKQETLDKINELSTDLRDAINILKSIYGTNVEDVNPT